MSDYKPNVMCRNRRCAESYKSYELQVYLDGNGRSTCLHATDGDSNIEFNLDRNMTRWLIERLQAVEKLLEEPEIEVSSGNCPCCGEPECVRIYEDGSVQSTRGWI